MWLLFNLAAPPRGLLKGRTAAALAIACCPTLHRYARRWTAARITAVRRGRLVGGGGVPTAQIRAIGGIAATATQRAAVSV